MAEKQTIFATRIHAHPSDSAIQVEVDGEMVIAIEEPTLSVSK